MDGFAHEVGYCELEKLGNTDIDEVSVSLIFGGMTQNVRVPREFVVNSQGLPMVKVGDTIEVDFRLKSTSSTRSFQGATYVRESLEVSRVLVFRKYVDKK